MRAIMSYIVQLAYSSSHPPIKPKHPLDHGDGVWRFARDASGQWQEVKVR